MSYGWILPNVLVWMLLTPPATEGVVSAVVVDRSGNPVEGALVRADRMGAGPTVSVVPECLTDMSGKCSIEHLAPGEYAVNAGKESAGYPNMYIPLYHRGVPSKTVRVSAGEPTKVPITIGPKGAFVEFAVTDAATGRPIKDPTVILRRAVDPNDHLSTGLDAQSRVLIPADDAMLIEVRADGYKPWHLESDSMAGRANALALHSEDTRKLTIRLQPAQ